MSHYYHPQAQGWHWARCSALEHTGETRNLVHDRPTVPNHVKRKTSMDHPTPMFQLSGAYCNSLWDHRKVVVTAASTSMLQLFGLLCGACSCSSPCAPKPWPDSQPLLFASSSLGWCWHDAVGKGQCVSESIDSSMNVYIYMYTYTHIYIYICAHSVGVFLFCFVFSF